MFDWRRRSVRIDGRTGIAHIIGAVIIQSVFGVRTRAASRKALLYRMFRSKAKETNHRRLS